MAIMDLLVALKWPLIIGQGFISLVLIVMILLQQGKGDDMGSALSGAMGSQIQGSGGQSKFLVKGTAIFAILFMINSIVLAKIFKHVGTASVGATVSEPMVPAGGTATNAVTGNAVQPQAAPATKASPAPTKAAQPSPSPAAPESDFPWPPKEPSP